TYKNAFLEQSTDVVSVWEGDSVSITCSMYNSENELGMYLRTRVQPENVLYVPKDKKPTVNKAFVDRIKYSKEGAKLTVTLLNVRESDSNFYLCTRFIIRNDRHVRLDGKTTIVVVKAPLIPRHTYPTCKTISSELSLPKITEFSSFPVPNAFKNSGSVVFPYIYKDLLCSFLDFSFQTSSLCFFK
uniref:Immunoglobulin domain-containing protein n=1 Tax=Anas zonorhyncha TaxID=75864 RepID=A0A8B9UJK7_9AVES